MLKKDNYEDIINLPHHVSVKFPHMSVYDRAAQFSPFAALKGFDEGYEVLRMMEDAVELHGVIEEELNEKLVLLAEQASKRPLVSVMYIVTDGKTHLRSYAKTQGRLKSVDLTERMLRLAGENIPFDQLYDVELV